jgi:hypothetical protein
MATGMLPEIFSWLQRIVEMVAENTISYAV